jgi:hypothetical protein
MSSLGGVFSACFVNLDIKNLYYKKNNSDNAQTLKEKNAGLGEVTKLATTFFSPLPLAKIN